MTFQEQTKDNELEKNRNEKDKKNKPDSQNNYHSEDVENDLEKSNESPMHRQIAYLQGVIKNINSTQNLDELGKTFINVCNDRLFQCNKVYNFNNDINNMRYSLSKMNYNLTKEGGQEILDQIIRTFIYDNRQALLGAGEISSIDYVKKNILNNYYSSKNGAKSITADMMRMSAEDDVENIHPWNYKNVYDQLEGWILDVAYSQGHKFYLSSKQNNIGKDRLVNETEGQHYRLNSSGENDGIKLKINRINDQRIVLERQKKDEIILLNRKYPSSDKKFFDFTNRRKNINKLVSMRKETLFSNDDLCESPYGNHVTHEDKMFAMVDAFYNKKHMRLNKEEREIVEKYKKNNREDFSKKRLKKIKYRIDRDFNVNIGNPLNVIKKCRQYIQVDKSIGNSTNFSMGHLEKQQGIQPRTVETVLSNVSNQSIKILGYMAGGSQDNSNTSIDYDMNKTIKIQNISSLMAIPKITKKGTVGALAIPSVRRFDLSNL